VDDVGDPPRVTFLFGFAGANSPSGAWGVNQQGDVVGFGANAAGFHRPFLRPAATGVMTDLGTLGGPGGDAFGISDTGYIVGQADVAAGRPHAFLRAPGVSTLFDLGTLGGPASAARAVNDAGMAVGESWTSDGLVHAFLAQGGQMLDLNARIPPGSGWVLSHAAGINNNGWIVGWGRFEGRTRGFLLVPDGPCYPDCNADGQLTVADFGCFQTKFVQGDPYADCTQDGQHTVADFGCFQTRFVSGCP
jgi:probable HAF family extracellular repeat protein